MSGLSICSIDLYFCLCANTILDNMTFIQRLENWLLYTVNDVIYSYYVFPEWDEYYSKVLGKNNMYIITTHIL